MCDFHVHGFNFDAASSGTYRIDQHPPTGRATVKSGTWTADSDGEWRTEVMTLPEGHYKLYVRPVTPRPRVATSTRSSGSAAASGGGEDTDFLGTKTGVLAATGLDLPMGAALGISFALLLAGAALMVLPSRMAVERKRRH